MHFIEEGLQLVDLLLTGPCIRQNVCTSLRSSSSFWHVTGSVTCIRQNVCTSLRIEQVGAELVSVVSLHTSKRMHFIEERRRHGRPCACCPTCIRQNVCTSLRTYRPHSGVRVEAACIRQNVCTSLRSYRNCQGDTWATHLHTSKRMHFIEETSSSTSS